jgi:predicted RNA methylase
MGTQIDMFGLPAFKPELGQWHTPMWLARKAAQWLTPGASVFEPACGGGNLIAAARERGCRVVAGDIDPAWAAQARCRFPEGEVPVFCGDFLEESELWCIHGPDEFFMNPPFEANKHMEFVLHALEIAGVVVGIFPASFEFGKERDDKLWASSGFVSRRARLPERVDYGGDQSPSFDSVVLRIEARHHLRAPGELNSVIEEVWRP